MDGPTRFGSTRSWPAVWPSEPGSLLEEGAVVPACYSRDRKQEKGHGHRHVSPHEQLLLLSLCGGSKPVYSPDVAVYGQRLQRTPGSGRSSVGPKPGGTGSLVS